MIASLAIVLGVVHLPFRSGPDPIGWHPSTRLSRDVIEISDLDAKRSSEPGVPVTRFGPREAYDGDQDRARDEERQLPAPPAHERPRRIPGLRVMSAAPQTPEIVGGIGAFYVHIEYPQRAIRERIEGRLMLSFVVDTEGRTNDVRVIESLHPVCDSAAVAALRKTRFVPGRREGEPVEVRMHLPVRFRLVSP